MFRVERKEVTFSSPILFLFNVLPPVSLQFQVQCHLLDLSRRRRPDNDIEVRAFAAELDKLELLVKECYKRGVAARDEHSKSIMELRERFGALTLKTRLSEEEEEEGRAKRRFERELRACVAKLAELRLRPGAVGPDAVTKEVDRILRAEVEAHESAREPWRRFRFSREHESQVERHLAKVFKENWAMK